MRRLLEGRQGRLSLAHDRPTGSPLSAAALALTEELAAVVRERGLDLARVAVALRQ